MRGLVAGWRAVAEGQKSPQAMVDYQLGLDQGGPLPLLTAGRRSENRVTERRLRTLISTCGTDDKFV